VLRTAQISRSAGLRGAVPIVLATYPVVAGVPASNELLDVVFVTVVVFTLLQGPTLPAVARRLRLAPSATPTELQLQAAQLERLDAELLALMIPPGSRFPVPGSRFPVPGSRFPVPGSRFPVPGCTASPCSSCACRHRPSSA
jgi:hypothetical protein